MSTIPTAVKKVTYVCLLILMAVLSGEIVRGEQIKFTFKTDASETLIRESAIGGLPYTILYSDLIRKGSRNIDNCMSQYKITTYDWNFNPRAPIAYDISVDVTFHRPWDHGIFTRQNGPINCLKEFFTELNANTLRMTEKIAEEICIRVPYYPAYEIEVSHPRISEFDFMFFACCILITMIGISRPMTSLTMLALVVCMNLVLRDPPHIAKINPGTVVHMPLFIFGYFSHNHMNCTNINIAPRYKWIYIEGSENDEYLGACNFEKLIPKRPEDSAFYKNESRLRPLIYLVWNKLLEYQTVTVQ